MKDNHDKVCVFCAKREAVAMHMRWPICNQCENEGRPRDQSPEELRVAELQAKLVWQKATYELPLGPDNDDDDRRWAYEAYYRTVLNLRDLGVKVA